MADFLIEIGTEEIPARMIDAATAELAKRVGDVLTRERLASAAQVETFSTPRRIAVLARGVAAKQEDIEEQVMGPSTKVAYKDGEPTPAAHAFAKKVNLDIGQIQKITTPKGEYIAAQVKTAGRSAEEILAASLPKEIAGIYWAKNMYWQEPSVRFVRPVRWMVALLDGKVVPVQFAGASAEGKSRGHRILHEGEVSVTSASAYKEDLLKGKVIADRAEREHKIRKALDAATRTVPGARWREDADLLATVVNLTEFPSAILGSFDKEYLTLPEEVLVTVMRDHQKYFAVEDANGKLAPHFLAVLNTDGDPEGLIRHGNERVLRARFNDARFFWDTDQKKPLEERVEMLKAVTFQKDLGSYHQKAERMAKLAGVLVGDLTKAGQKIDKKAVEQAAMLSKTDLTAELVKEFTELQGIVGGLYARAQKLDAAVADAIYDQYKPESMEDSVPRTIEGAVLAIADKADSIAGMFALGLEPTGSKDPFALRRQANGIVKILAEHKLPLDLGHIFTAALAGYKGSEAEKKFKDLKSVPPKIAAFFRERIDFYLREVLKFPYDEANAALDAGFIDVADTVARAHAIHEVRPQPDFEAVATSFKRMKNILRQAGDAAKNLPKLDAKALQEEAEKDLAARVPETSKRVEALRKEKKYAEALSEVAKLRPAIDAFFDKVMVMVDDAKLKQNRLALLHTIVQDFSKIADFSEIVTEKK